GGLLPLVSIGGSAAAVGAVGERAEQQRDVIVLLPGLDREVDGDRGMEMVHLTGCEVGAGAEHDPVVARGEVGGPEVGGASVVVSARRGDDLGSVVEGDLEVGGGCAHGRVEGVCGDEAHDRIPSSLRAAIWMSCSPTSAVSSASELSTRRSSSDRTSSGLRPAARMRKTRSKRSS